jgi:beta-fructofuranosidase
MVGLKFFCLFICLFLTNKVKSQHPYPNRPTFHFVPVPIAWMNDPNGPFYDPVTQKYHLFFQYYTPRQWGHAISDDLLRWINLPIAIPNDTPYNKGGVYTGSTTVLSNAIGGYTRYIMYSVNTNNMMCIAWPSDPTDVNLTKWTNDPQNCVLSTPDVPAGRDPASSWSTDGGKTWTFTYTDELSYQTTDWRTWTKGPGQVFKTPGGIECPDFYELPKAQQFTGATHVVKVSMGGQDWWTFGTYDATTTKFTPFPSPPYNENDGFCSDCLFDHGNSWYAAKSFYDAKNDRQIIFGWLREQSGQNNKGWQGSQSLPRTITLLNAHQSPTGYPRIISYPIKEFDSLRMLSTHFSYNGTIASGQDMIFNTRQIAGNALDIELVWASGGDCGVYINGDGNAGNRLGSTYTRIGVNFEDVPNAKTFYVQPNGQGATQETVPGWTGRTSIKVRIIVDHSVVTAFINDGLISSTRRVYQNLATYSVGVYAYQHNNGDSCVLQSFNAYNVTTVIQPPP